MKCHHCQEQIISPCKYLKCSECVKCYHLACLTEGITSGSCNSNRITEADYHATITNKAAWKCPVCDTKKHVCDETSLSNSDSDPFDSTGAKGKILCLSCNKGFSHNAQRAVCVKCDSNFHFKCVNMTKQDYFPRKTQWSCENCSKETEVQEVVASLEKAAFENISINVVLNEMRMFRQDVLAQTREIQDSLNSYSDWLAENTEKINLIDDKITALTNDLTYLKQENTDLVKKNEVLTKRLNHLEQSVIENKIEINGIPFQKNENILDILNNVSRAIGFEFNKNMVDNCYRYRQSGRSRGPTGIAVRFLRKLDKDEFINRRRVKRNLNSRDLGFMEGEASPIYVNDSLTPEKRKLLNAAREAKRQKLYTYLWVKNGRIFMRKNEGDRFVVIEDLDDIDKLA